MDVYIARQPILNSQKKLFAYELLYRGTETTQLKDVDGEQATSSLLSSTFFMDSINIISGAKPCFVNFTEDLLLKHIPETFPQNKVVVEVLESVEPTDEIIHICRSLNKQGYKIALDDFVYDPKMLPLVRCADIIKIDIRLTPLEIIRDTLGKLTGYRKALLAEKVETIEEFELAKELGFHYFQGFFFSKPEKIRLRELNPAKVNHFKLLSEIAGNKATLENLHKIISSDVVLSYKLLRYINSAYYYREEKVKNVKHAIAYLGEREIRKFLMLITVAQMGKDKPDELIRLSLIRAKFCELVAGTMYSDEITSKAYLMGLFSLIDSMLNMKMDVIMGKLPLADDIKEALIYRSGTLASLLNVITAYERKNEKVLAQMPAELSIDSNQLTTMYLDALKYTSCLF